MMRPQLRLSDASRPKVPGTRCALWVAAAALLLVATSSTLVHAEAQPAADADGIASDDGTGSPPPGTLSSQGMVPAGGLPPATGPDSGDFGIAGAPVEPIGHVPGPGEGVYGDPPNSGTGNPETRGWAYDPEYFFAMTHGLETDTDLGPNGRRWVRPLTLTFDVLTLPTAALAGLSGRAPSTDTDTQAEAPPAATPADAPAAQGEGASDPGAIDPSGSSAPTAPESDATPPTPEPADS